MNLRIVVLPAKVLADGTHKVRIAISHRNTTRYFVTRFIVPSQKNICGGQVVGVPNAAYINQQLRNRMTKIYEAYDKLQDTEYLSCSQLVEAIENAEKASVPRTIQNVADEYLAVRGSSIAPRTQKIFNGCVKDIVDFFGEDFLVRNLTPTNISQFKEHLAKRINNTTQSIKLNALQKIVNFAIRHNYVVYDVPPFTDVTIPKSNIRDCAITLEQLRKLRDLEFENTRGGRGLRLTRDFFMLSFYMCGMNLVDLLAIDTTGAEVSFTRTKTKHRSSTPNKTIFTIQPEARELLSQLSDNNGKILSKYSYESMSNYFLHYMRILGDMVGTKHRLIYYSARKTFAQLANELLIKDSIIEYCIGDTVANSKVIGHYIHVTQKMADRAIRKVFDAVASTKTLDELIEENL